MHFLVFQQRPPVRDKCLLKGSPLTEYPISSGKVHTYFADRFGFQFLLLGGRTWGKIPRGCRAGRFSLIPRMFFCRITVCSCCLSVSQPYTFFPRASERRVLLIVGVCQTFSHLQIFTSSHPHTFTSHLQIFTSSHLLIFAFSSSRNEVRSPKLKKLC